MKFRVLNLLLVIGVGLAAGVNASDELQSNRKLETIARFTAAIISQKHYSQHPLDDKISSKLFDEYLKALDPNKMFFTVSDINKFSKFRNMLDDQISIGTLDFAFDVYNKYIERYEEYCDFSKKMLEKGIDFTVDENYFLDRSEAKWPADENEMHELWRKRTKNIILTYILMDKAAEYERANLKTALPATAKQDSKWKKKTPEERFLMRLDQTLSELKKEAPLEVMSIYLSSLTRVYDPHSAYMSPSQEESFNIQMQLSLVGIGAVLSTDDCYTKIVKVMPGGPADKDGRLKAEDRIIAVAQDNQEPVDVIGMSVDKVVEMIRGKEGTNVHLTVLPAAKGQNAAPEIITLVRNKVELKDQGASGKVETIKDADGNMKKVGVITLPSFYMDFNEAAKGNSSYKNSTDDVAAILKDFEKEGIDGLVLDLRSNGGGSLVEAVRLTGLFIEDGPVVQIKDSLGRIMVKDDDNPEIQYSGPLVVLVNKLSASATEIFAGAIKDYKRGVIIGDTHTHGKGTVQTVYQLKDLLSIFGVSFKAGSIKFTNAKFYRVNGHSTQRKGVSADIAFPSFTDAMKVGEVDLANHLPWDAIKPVSHKIYQPELDKDIEILKNKSDVRLNHNPKFALLKNDIESFKRMTSKKEVSLSQEKRWAEYLKEKKYQDQQTQLLRLDDKLDDTQKDQSGHKDDLYLNEAENILLDYISLLHKPAALAQAQAKATVTN